MKKHFVDGDELCRYVREQTGDTALLAFSRGKDAIAAWLQLREHFPRVVPFYLETEPGLKFIDRSIRYYEDFFGTTIQRFPHPNLYRQLNALVYQPPERIRVMNEVRMHWGLTHEDVAQALRLKFNCPKAYVANGVRAADSPMRRMVIDKHGPINHNRMTFCPVFDWVTDDLVEEFNRVGVKLPVDYKLWGRTFDGLDDRFVVKLQEKFPDDYERLVEWFPLLVLDGLRRKFAQQGGAQP